MVTQTTKWGENGHDRVVCVSTLFLLGTTVDHERLRRGRYNVLSPFHVSRRFANRGELACPGEA